MRNTNRICTLLLLTLICGGCSENAEEIAERPNRGHPYGLYWQDAPRTLPNNGRPEARVAFPEIENWDTLRITLERSPCEGSCAIYGVEIRGDGTVLYEGRGNVAVHGRFETAISVETVRALFERFRQAEYFWLHDRYFAPVIDHPIYYTTIAFDGHQKAITNNAGLTIGMPMVVQEIEYAIDVAAGIEKWINGDETTIPTLRARGWNFAGKESTGMIASAALYGSEELALDFLREGAPVNGPMPASYGDGPTPLMAAAEMGYTELLVRLLETGADLNERTSYGSTPLMMAALSGIPEMVSALLEAGVDVQATDQLARTVLFFGPRWQRFKENEDARIDRPEVVRLLVAAGADVNATDEGGDSLLTQYGMENDVLSALLELGADPNHIARWR